MSKKTLLVLAASQYQIPTILTAKCLGYRVITTDNVAENPGHVLADKSYGIDTTDKQAILKLALQERIDGIIAACTDVAVPTAAYVAKQLGLPGVPPECANIVCDKIAFREFLREQGFPSPDSYPVTHDSKPDQALFQHPWILKPDRSSGSKGIFMVSSLEEFFQYIPETLSFSPTGKGILEKFLSGFQGTCEGVLKQGQLALTFVLDRQTVNPPYVVTCGHHVPSILSPQLQKKLFLLLEEIWNLLEVSDGPFDCDFVATEEEIYLLELTPRMGGNSIANLLQKAADFSLIEYSIKQACGDPVSLPTITSIRPTAVVLLGVKKKGYLSYNQAELERLKREPWVESLSIDLDIETPVFPFINGRHRVGEAFVFGKDREDLELKVRELKQRLQLGAI